MRLLLSTGALAAAALVGAPTPSHAVINLQTNCCTHPMQPKPAPKPMPPKPAPPKPMQPVHWGGGWGGGHGPSGGHAGGSWGGGHGWGNGGHVGWSHPPAGSHPMGMHYYGMGPSRGFFWHASRPVQMGGGHWGGSGGWGHGSTGWHAGSPHAPSGTHPMGMHYYGMGGGSLAARYGKIERFVFVRPVSWGPVRPIGPRLWASKPRPGTWHVGSSSPSGGNGGSSTHHGSWGHGGGWTSAGSSGLSYRIRYGYRYYASFKSKWSGWEGGKSWSPPSSPHLPGGHSPTHPSSWEPKLY